MTNYVTEITLVLLVAISAAMYLYIKIPLIKNISRLLFVLSLSALIVFETYLNGISFITNIFLPLAAGGMMLTGGFFILLYLDKRAERINNKEKPDSE